jgi:Flp pilus assembly protein TadD
LLQQQGHLDEAELHLRRAIAARVNYASAHRTLGVLLNNQRRYADAVPVWTQAMALKPDDRVICEGLGRTLVEVGQFDPALGHYRAALRQFPDDNGFLAAQGAVLALLSRWEEGAEILQRAAAVDPTIANIWSNLATCLKMSGRYPEAAAAVRRATEIDPGMANAQWNLSLLELLQGHFRAGWDRYDWRWQVDGFPSPRRSFPIPVWRGESLVGKRVLVHWEQGFGDTIQFVRLLPALKARGATVVLECQAPLCDLFATAAGADVAVRTGNPLPLCDYYVALLGICRFIDLDLLHPERAGLPDVPYLRADAARMAEWAPRLAPAMAGRKRIALVWAGNSTHGNDHSRSLPLAPMSWLFEGRDWDCHLLQVNVRDEDAALLDAYPQVRRLGGELRDFADTAAVLAQMDLLITIDTSVAHLAGALGVPVWTMLAKVPDWRWQLGRDDAPWYPSLRLFRQEIAGEWGPVIERVRQELGEMGFHAG